MLSSQPKNRVQAIKSKFENLSAEPAAKQSSQLYKLKNVQKHKENTIGRIYSVGSEVESSGSDDSSERNSSFLYKSDVKRTELKPSLTRQSSDPGKKLHRSHAFRCDRTQKITSPNRAGSCNLKMDRKLSKDRLKKLGDILDEQMRKENFKLVGKTKEFGFNSVPDENVPPHILAQYAKVIKPKKKDDRNEAMTDSGVSSETENLDDDKGKVKKITNHFERDTQLEKHTQLEIDHTQIESEDTQLESTDTHLESEDTQLESEDTQLENGDTQLESEKTEIVNHSSNLDVMVNLAGSSETMKLERKNAHLILTDTLKKALKQPLPPGPPPKKPPRTFNIPTIPENEKKDAKRKLEKLEQVLLNRETAKKDNIYDIAEENLSLKKPKEIHYLCTEILDITQRTLLPNESLLKNCFKLNCAGNYNSMSSLPYTRLSTGFDSNRNSFKNWCSCSNDNLLRTFNECDRQFLDKKCTKCQAIKNCHGDSSNTHLNDSCVDGSSDEKCTNCQVDKLDRFKCHLDCNCKHQNSKFYDEHIYDEPCVDDRSERRNNYGTLNVSAFSKSLEDLRGKDQKEDIIYEIPCDQRPSTPDPTSPKMQKTDFQKLLQNFENGVPKKPALKKSPPAKLSQKSLEDIKIAPKSPDTGNVMPKFPDNGKLSPISPGDNKPSPKSDSEKTSPKFEVGKAEVKFAKKDRKFMTEVKRYKPDRSVTYSLPRKNPQLDVDRENLNALMNEIYETVTAACNMEENKPGSFPTDQAEGSASEESVKLTRSLTEKRKNYVRRVSSRVAYLEPKNIRSTRYRHQTSICSYKSDVLKTDSANQYSTFRSWKSFRASQSNLASKMDSDSKFNLTDSTGNIMSIKNDFDASDGSIDTMSIDEKTGCVDIDLPFEPRERGLFNVCLLVGLNYMTGQAYVKSVFPSQVQVPQHIENLIFPETLSQDKGEWSADAAFTQCYSFVLTDERGERSYGYCRRVLPEGATACLPLCYCLIGKYRAPGFYYKVLQEIESHHGSSHTAISSVLQQLFESDFPNPGEAITLTIDTADVDTDTDSDRCNVKSRDTCNCDTSNVNSDIDSVKLDSDSKNNSDIDKCYVKNSDCDCKKLECLNSDSCKCKVNGSVKCQSNTEKSYSEKSKSDKSYSEKSKTMPDMRVSEKFYDPENNNSLRELMLSLNNIRVTTISRPLEPRAEESSSCELLDSLGAGLLVKVFGSLLLERKLIVRADKLSALSSWLEALQSALYPFVWQQPLISCVPAEIQRAVLDAPLPILAGMLDKGDIDGDSVEEGMFIDLTHPSKVLCYQGDEATILPTNSYKTLKTSLQMESIKNKERDDTRTRNVMISEAFLRFFVDILGDFWRFFSVGALKDGDMGKGDIIFDKENFIKNASSKQNQYFLEWFTETAMFNHFIQNMAVRYKQTEPDSIKHNDSIKQNDSLIDTPTPNYYQLFEERINSRRTRSAVDRTGYKSALNKRVKLLKARLKDLVG